MIAKPPRRRAGGWLAERPDTEWWIYDHTGQAVTSLMNEAYWRARVEARPPGRWQRVLRLLGIVR